MIDQMRQRRRRSSIEEVIQKTRQKLEKTKQRLLKKHSDEIADIFVKLTEMAGVDAFEFLNAHFKMQPMEREGHLRELLKKLSQTPESNSQ